ncbi:MAG: nuclear transport factor 2 family protein [Mycobacteriaceae bacterium]
MVDQEELLALVRSSPVAVAGHDKAGWVGLFAERYVIEDPVGSRPVRGPSREPISRFWDTFIAPNDIVFEAHHDWVDGFHVVRDVTVVTTLATGLQVRTPAHLRYETIVEDGDLKVQRMAAHWEPAPVFAQLMRPGAAYVRSLVSMTGRMLRNLGPGGTARFVGAIRSVGEPGKQAVLDHLGSSVHDVSKVIASGNVVTANCTVDGRPSAVLATLDRRTREVLDCRVYTEPA